MATSMGEAASNTSLHAIFAFEAHHAAPSLEYDCGTDSIGESSKLMLLLYLS